MEFKSEQKTTSLFSKTNLKFKIYENKIHYVWDEENINYTKQIWYAISDLDGSNFIESQLTNELKHMNKPQLYIYNNVIYITWYGMTEEGGKYQIWTTSMNIDGSEFKILHITDTEFGAINPKIVVKNNMIYLVYQQRFLNYQYYHIYRARLNLDGSGFESHYIANQTSANETVVKVDILVDENSNDNIVYYMWDRRYPIGVVPTLKIYYTDFDTGFNEINCIPITTIGNTSPRNFFVKENKVYFTQANYIPQYSICSIIDVDGTNLTTILENRDKQYINIQVIDNIIYFVLRIRDENDIYQIYTANINIDGTNYQETQLTQTNYQKSELEFVVNNNIMHISWLQLDNEEYRQVWLGILGEEKEQPQENSKLIYIIGGALLLWLLTRKEEK